MHEIYSQVLFIVEFKFGTFTPLTVWDQQHFDFGSLYYKILILTPLSLGSFKK
jgi:hypothetical protein